jgi:hypothetical protein
MFEVGKRAPRITYLHIMEQICHGWDKCHVNLIVRDGIVHVTIYFPEASVFEKKVYCAKVLIHSGNCTSVKHRSRTGNQKTYKSAGQSPGMLSSHLKAGSLYSKYMFSRISSNLSSCN